MPHQMDFQGTSYSGSTHYEILGLSTSSGPGRALTAQQLKAAYRRALLQHHPDKSQVKSEAQRPGSAQKSAKSYTVDQISQAYAILSVTQLRSEYDRILKLKSSPVTSGGQKEDQAFRTGFETLDLDDLSFDEEAGVWFRGCRCGDNRGFLVREEDLEEASEDGELHVGCRGCSLWLRLLFGVVEEDQGAQVVADSDKG